MKLFIIQPSPATSSLLAPNIPLAPCSQTAQSMFFP